MSNRDFRRNGMFASLLGFFILFGSPTAANMEMAKAAKAAEAAEALETAEIAAMAVESEEPLQWDYVVGRYQMIGRHPDSAKTYTGAATIERVGSRLRLIRDIAGMPKKIIGVIRRAQPGEAYVLAFDWGSKIKHEMVCVIGSDLDNYARLTCQWGVAGNPHTQPGMEAYFTR